MVSPKGYFEGYRLKTKMFNQQIFDILMHNICKLYLNNYY